MKLAMSTLAPALASALLAASTAQAGIVLVPLGTDAPPVAVNDIHMHPFPFDDRLFDDVTSVADTFGRDLRFSFPLSVRQIGLGWATWSHGYAGNVYYCNGRPDITVTFPRGVKAAYFYAEPGPFNPFEVTVVASDGSVTTYDDPIVHGRAGAHGWGIYSTDGKDVVSIRVVAHVDISIGEFAVSAPCPADLDADGFIDFSDFLLFLSLFDAQDLAVDYTQDGLVDFADYLLFLNYYGNSCAEN